MKTTEKILLGLLAIACVILVWLAVRGEATVEAKQLLQAKEQINLLSGEIEENSKEWNNLQAQIEELQKKQKDLNSLNEEKRKEKTAIEDGVYETLGF